MTSWTADFHHPRQNEAPGRVDLTARHRRRHRSLASNEMFDYLFLSRTMIRTAKLHPASLRHTHTKMAARGSRVSFRTRACKRQRAYASPYKCLFTRHLPPPLPPSPPPSLLATPSSLLVVIVLHSTLSLQRLTYNKYYRYSGFTNKHVSFYY